MIKNSQEQRPLTVEYQAPTKIPHNGFATLSFASALFCVALTITLARAGRDAFVYWFLLFVAMTAVCAGIAGIRLARPEDRGGMARACVGLILGGIFSVLQLVTLAFTSTYADANQVKCQSNLRQIGQGLMLYANDHQQKLPSNFGQLISDADLNPECFICWSTDDQKAIGPTTQQILVDFAKPGRCSYVYLGSGMTTATLTRDFVLAYEPLENHDGKGAVFVFGDFRIEWRNAKQARKMIEQLKKGVNPPKQ